MLVLARKLNQNIVIDGRIIIKVLRVERDVVKLGIQAPLSVPVHREEVYQEILRSNRAALHQGRRAAPKLPGPLSEPSAPPPTDADSAVGGATLAPPGSPAAGQAPSANSERTSPNP